jgi:hypothetical protein
MTDAEFLSNFRKQGFAAAEWTHRAHVRCAYLMLRELPFDQAMDAMRSGIRLLNKSHGLVETPERGYHETLTRAWLTVIAAAIASRGVGSDFDTFAAEHPHLLCRTLLRLYYSPTGMPPTARYEFVPPDLAPLPRAG